MDGFAQKMTRPLRMLALVALGAAAAGCEALEDDPFGPGDGEAPSDVRAEAAWVFQGWDASGDPVGYSAVEVTWLVPVDWRREAFRVYGRRSTQRDYTLIATVTSCMDDLCRYTDLNVVPGGSYDYFVTAVDEDSGWESESSEAAGATVPSIDVPEAPSALRAVALDDAVYLRWDDTGATAYRVILEQPEGQGVYVIGETDGTSFLDDRAENGVRYRYHLAAVNEFGHVSRLGPVSPAVPRPDHAAELVYAFPDSAAASGFRFVASDSLSPVIAGGSAQAHWRLDVVDGNPSLVPLNGTAVTSGVLTTALTCGPASDPDCVAIHSAADPLAPRDFSATPVALDEELTYLLRVRDASGRTRYGKIRAQILGSDQQGRDLLIFDWAYQLLPDEPSLGRQPG